eukprot:762574-Hanusia_phi.AAC.3
MRKSEARLHLRVRGGECVEDGTSMRGGKLLRVWVDDEEEGTSTDCEMTVWVSELLSGSHQVAAMVVEEEGGAVAAAFRSEFVILQDIEILFPSDNYVYCLLYTSDAADDM